MFVSPFVIRVANSAGQTLNTCRSDFLCWGLRQPMVLEVGNVDAEWCTEAVPRQLRTRLSVVRLRPCYACEFVCTTRRSLRRSTLPRNLIVVHTGTVGGDQGRGDEHCRFHGVPDESRALRRNVLPLRLPLRCGAIFGAIRSVQSPRANPASPRRAGVKSTYLHGGLR
eukprot:SAG11_NODE_5099_length_1665_cov_0.844189_2_plen_168_part_00